MGWGGTWARSRPCEGLRRERNGRLDRSSSAIPDLSFWGSLDTCWVLKEQDGGKGKKKKKTGIRERVWKASSNTTVASVPHNLGTDYLSFHAGSDLPRSTRVCSSSLPSSPAPRSRPLHRTDPTPQTETGDPLARSPASSPGPTPSPRKKAAAIKSNSNSVWMQLYLPPVHSSHLQIYHLPICQPLPSLGPSSSTHANSHQPENIALPS